MKKNGFTLMELLVTVIILAILASMAVPMYKRAIEKSRRAEVSATLLRLSEAKMRTMSSMDLGEFNKEFGVEQLDSTFQESNNFRYSLYPNNTYPDAVCAVSKRGDSNGTVFLYLGEAAAECNCTSAGENTPCGLFCSNGDRLFCYSSGKGCDIFGVDNLASAITCETWWNKPSN